MNPIRVYNFISDKVSVEKKTTTKQKIRKRNNIFTLNLLQLESWLNTLDYYNLNVCSLFIKMNIHKY